MEHYSPIWYPIMKPTNILGISCSSRILGVAVFYTRSLVDYGVTLNKQSWCAEKQDRFLGIIKKYCTAHTITNIVCVVPLISNQTACWQAMHNAIIEFASTAGITITCFSHRDLYEAFANPSTKTKASLIRRITMFYDELEPLELKQLQSKSKYYIKLFEAVAGASLQVLQQ